MQKKWEQGNHLPTTVREVALPWDRMSCDGGTHGAAVGVSQANLQPVIRIRQLRKNAHLWMTSWS